MPLDKFSEVEGAPGLLYYDTSPGKGAPVEKGQRVAVHFDVKLGKITFFTSRVGTGVTGGVPYGVCARQHICRDEVSDFAAQLARGGGVAAPCGPLRAWPWQVIAPASTGLPTAD